MIGWEQLLASLSDHRRQLDRQVVQLRAAEHVGTIYCKEGCGNCCSLAVNCSFPEAVAIAMALDDVQRKQLDTKLPLLRQVSTQAEDLKQFLRLFRQQLGGCPFLDADTACCTTYSLRPLSCRALLSSRNSNWCAVDFADLHPLEKQAFVSSLDPELVAFPTHYLAASQELGIELETELLVDMRDCFGVSLSGNLIYQVWLEAEYRLSEVMTEGFEATLAFLLERELDLPFLLQLQGD